jgi:hypothetical protein
MIGQLNHRERGDAPTTVVVPEGTGTLTSCGGFLIDRDSLTRAGSQNNRSHWWSGKLFGTNLTLTSPGNHSASAIFRFVGRAIRNTFTSVIWLCAARD